jgi:hypothetical protein
MTQASRAQAFPGKQAVCYQGTTQAVKILEQQTGFFKSPLFAGHIDLNKYLRSGEYGCESIHDLFQIMHREIRAQKKAARTSGRLDVG